jgi:hypothetical protein
MTVMIQRLKSVLTRPVFVPAKASGDYGVWVSRWTARQPLPPPLPAFEDADLEALFDGVFTAA